MTMNYLLMTDSDSDIPYSLKQQYDIPVVAMPYSVNGKEYFDDLGQTLNHKSYFDMMRAGAAPTTAALNEISYLEFFEPYLADGKDILFIAFSSKMSMTINAMRAAAEQLLEKYPGRRIRIVDTLSICLPQTILVLKAHEMYRAGKSLDEVGDWVEANKLRVHAWVTVEDLKYLQRGGRIKPMSAALGTMLDLKPIIAISRDGLLVSVDKVRGRRKALSAIVDKTLECVDDPAEAMPFIVHADALEDANFVKAQALQKMPALGDIRVVTLGPVIGAHCGPGTVAFCVYGKERKQ